MKYLLGVFALLLLVSTLAFGQSYQPLPFPQEANTALQGGSYDQDVDINAPSSMASNQAYDHRDQVDLGSPFPSAGNPSLGRSTEDQMTPSWKAERELGSPFPSAANPSSEE